MRDPLALLQAELEKARAEREALAEALQVSERFRLAVESATVAMMSVSGVTGRYLFANEAYLALVGYAREELLSSDAYDIWVRVTPPEDVEAERHALERLAKGEIERYTLEKRLVHKSGSARWVRVEVTARRETSGRLESILCFFTDIHDQRKLADARDRLESQLRQSQKLEALGKLAGGVAHDFNNRLVIIMGYTELIKRAVSDELLSQHADMVLASAQRAAELTRQLLAYSRHQVLRSEVFDLNQIVDRLQRMLERLIGDTIELSTKLSAKNPVYSDPGQIEQVILNLVINARDAMPRGGKLELETEDLVVQAGEDPSLPAGDYVKLVVKDTGTGIADDVLPRIFEPFFSTKEAGHGTGLGLSMVEGIIRQSGGAVRVQTRLGQGSAFSTYLPRAQQQLIETRYVAQNAALRGISFETVLVCDDDDDVRRLLSEVLGLRGYRTLQARNGRHALEVAEQHQAPIHLLVTDLVMPEMGGAELARELRKRTPEICVLYVSGYNDSADWASLALDSNTHFLAKPFLPGDLTRAVFSILEAAPRRES